MSTKNENDSPLRALGKEYFRGLLKDKNITGNLRLGDELKVRIQFYDKDGLAMPSITETIKKEEL